VYFWTNHMVLGYIDPGSGSMLLQLLLGGLAGLWVVFKLWGRRILTKFGIGKSEKEGS
jgi:hypothetical protein